MADGRAVVIRELRSRTGAFSRAVKLGDPIGVTGIAVNSSGPAGQDLHAMGILAFYGVMAGNGKAFVRLAAADVLTLWCYGNGAVISVNALADKNTHWAARWVAP